MFPIDPFAVPVPEHCQCTKPIRPKHSAVCFGCELPIKPKAEIEVKVNVAPLQKKAGKPDLWLIPGSALKRAAGAMSYGNQAYAEGTWQNLAIRDLVNAALRHLTSYTDGETKDPESGLSHLDHALASILFAVANEVTLQTNKESKANQNV